MITSFIFFIVLIYVATIAYLIYGFTKVNSFEYLELNPKTKFTIIVPFRNEAENLPFLLERFSNINYPLELFEIILVDDESEDVFKTKSYKFKISVIKNIRVSHSPKKDAITTAIQLVKSEWIITTDADCVVNKNWLTTLDNYIQNNEVGMLVGAVTYDCEDRFLHHFQQLDLMSLQGATIGSFGLGKGFMCNGANLAYKKSLFYEVNGFDGNNTIASGDDVFLLQKAIAKFPENVHYLKSENNIVITKPVNDWKSLFYQRVRWASKTSSYQSQFGKILGLIVFGGNLAWVLGFGFWVFGWFSFSDFVLCVVCKFCIDTVLLFKTQRFFRNKKTPYLILSSLIYPFFSVSVALYSLFGKYEWKGRKF